jgi:hypothetical protein
LPIYLLSAVIFLTLSFLYLQWHSQGQMVRADAGRQILNEPWILSGSNGAAEAYAFFNKTDAVLRGQSNLVLTFNTFGSCLLGGDASAIIFDQPAGRWNFVSLSEYAQPCYDGWQEVVIPLDHFSMLNLSKPIDNFHVRFWLPDDFRVSISSARVVSTSPHKKQELDPSPLPTINPEPPSEPEPTPPPPVAEDPTPANQHPWSIRSVSTMKEAKDRLCSPRSRDFIDQWVATAKELGVNYIALETPYDDPACGSALEHTREWVESIRAHNLKVWHRHMPLAFEGIYGVQKDPSKDYIAQITNYIRTNPHLFEAGDIFTPTPEPQNGGIKHITYCYQSICQFTDATHFNHWLREAITQSQQAFADIGLGGQIEVGYYGFDGFVAWGSNNPDWNGVLEDETVKVMGNITIDHYPEAIGDTMENALDELTKRYPGVPIVIGEWGAIENRSKPIIQVHNAMSAALRPEVIGFNYWHMGVGGHEALIDEDFNRLPHFEAVQSFFKLN